MRLSHGLKYDWMIIIVSSNNDQIDDINTGAETESNQDDQRLLTQENLWEQGCVGLEYLVSSGLKPGGKISFDGVSMSYLNINRNPEIMLYTPG